MLVGLLVVAFRRLDDRGQLEGERWEPFTLWSLRFLLGGLSNTLRAAAAAMVFALVLGALLALLRLSQTAPVRWLAAAFIEFFRGVPLILLIFFSYSGLRALRPRHRAVLGAGPRAGPLQRGGPRRDLPGRHPLARPRPVRGGLRGLGYWQTMRRAVPQAVRRMVPAIVSQLVTLLKDTSLGFVITYEELLRRSWHRRVLPEPAADPVIAASCTSS